VSADEIAMALHFSVLASLCAAASGLVVGRPLAPSLLPHAPRCSQCRMSLPIDESSTIAQLRAFITEQGLDVKTTGKGRTKAVIYGEVVALCSSSGGAPAPAQAHADDAADAEATAVAKQAAEAAMVAETEAAVAEAAAANAAAAAAAAEEAEAEKVAAAAAADDAEDGALGTAPDGFEWGGTY